jgi:PAS domain S-box-containing protein
VKLGKQPKTEKFFYRYTEKEQDFKRLFLLYGTAAVIFMPLFLLFIHYSQLPPVYAEVTMFSIAYVLAVLFIFNFLKKHRQWVFFCFYLLFCAITIYSWFDLLENTSDKFHFIGFLFLVSSITISIQRYYFAFAYTLLNLILLISSLVLGKIQDAEFLALFGLIFILGSLTTLILYSRNKMIRRIQDYSTYLSSILNQPGIGVALIRTTPELKMVDSNTCVAKLLGIDTISSSEEVGHLLIELIGDEIINSSSGKEIEIKKDYWIQVILDNIQLKEGEFVLVKLINISESKQHQIRLQQSEEKFRKIIANIPDAIVLVDGGKVVFANEEALELLNINQKELSDSDFIASIQEEYQSMFSTSIHLNLEEKDKIIGYVKLKHNDLDVEFTMTNTQFDTRDVTMIILKDVSLVNKLAAEKFRAEVAENLNEQLKKEIRQRELSERNLREQSLKFSAIIENSKNTLIWTIDRNFRLITFNAHFHETVQALFKEDLKREDDLKVFFMDKMSADEWEYTVNEMNKARSGIPGQIENKFTFNGKDYWFETFLNPIYNEQGECVELSFVSHHITDKKDQEKELRDSLREKEVLLKEVHHRVKNNLQVISSILNLQSSYVEDEQLKQVLRESQNRIKTMSFIHENLYQKDQFSEIDFSDYVKNLSTNLLHSYQIYTNLVEIKYELSRVFLSLDQAIPCGLIVNELVSNALKHAFPDGKEGMILIKLMEENNKVHLCVKDNGVGMPNNFDIRHSETLGIQLVVSLAEQLDANLDIKSDGGTEYLITFELIKA